MKGIYLCELSCCYFEIMNDGEEEGSQFTRHIGEEYTVVK